jgi:hypothetical protein
MILCEIETGKAVVSRKDNTTETKKGEPFDSPLSAYIINNE